jgi:uncharacterized membrane protein
MVIENMFYKLMHLLFMATVITILLGILGIVFFAYLNLAVWVWGHYGMDSFLWFLMGSALALALMLVASW